MAVILDTTTLPASDREAAFDATLNSTTMPVRTQRVTDEGEVFARIQYWQLGPGVHQVHTETSGFRFSRTGRHVRLAGVERVSLAMHLRDPYVLSQRDLTWTSGDAGIRLVDLTSPYSYMTRGRPIAQSFDIECERLGLPVEVLRAASPRLASSPLYELARTYFRQLPAVAARVEGTAAAAMLGASATELARALIASASDVERFARPALADSLLARIDMYIEQHLGEVDLTPTRIAAEHSISVRYLHRLFESRDLTVSQWIVARRLEAARRELASDRARNSGVAAVARRWGFVNATHFARRFREAYGMSPLDWQRLNQREPSDVKPGQHRA